MDQARPISLSANGRPDAEWHNRTERLAGRFAVLGSSWVKRGSGWWAIKRIQALLHFPQALKHLDARQPEGGTSFQGQQIANASAQVLADQFTGLLWGGRWVADFPLRQGRRQQPGDGQNAPAFNLLLADQSPNAARTSWRKVDFHGFIRFCHRLGRIIQVMDLAKTMFDLWKNHAHCRHQSPLLVAQDACHGQFQVCNRLQES